eukprot:2771996-Prymnesium_polylepis.1
MTAHSCGSPGCVGVGAYQKPSSICFRLRYRPTRRSEPVGAYQNPSNESVADKADRVCVDFGAGARDGPITVEGRSWSTCRSPAATGRATASCP